jgi:hypothetical protein
VSEELTQIEAAERQADLGEALFEALAGAPLSPEERRGNIPPVRHDLPLPS